MALEKKELERVFKYNDIELKDIDNTMSLSQIQDFYGNQYPEIINATVSGPKIENDKIVYSFEMNVGKKG